MSKEKKKNRFSFWIKIGVFFLSTLATIILTIVVTNYFQRISLSVSVHHIQLNSSDPNKHLYIFNIKNTGRKHINDLKLFIRKNGNIFSSTFNEEITTNKSFPSENDLITLNEGIVQIFDSTETSDLIIKYRENKSNKGGRKQTESQYNHQIFTEVKKTPSFYYISFGSYTLSPDEEIHASVYLDYKLSSQDIYCFNSDKKFKIGSIDYEDGGLFKTALTTISIASDVTSNKIFVEGFGIGNSSIIAQAKILARNTALSNLYKETAKKLYGFKIYSEDNSHLVSKTANNNEDFNVEYNFKNKIVIEGQLDKSRFTVYDERFFQNGTEIICELKAYYNLPFNIEYKNPEINFKYSLTDLFPPTTKGEQPNWIYRTPYSDEYIFSVGSSDVIFKNSRILNKQIAYNNAIDYLAQSLETKVKNITDSYIDNSNTEKFESLTRFVTDQFLSDIRVIEYYLDKEGRTYVLIAINQEMIGQKLDVLNKSDKLKIDYDYEQFKKAFEEEIRKIQDEEKDSTANTQ